MSEIIQNEQRNKAGVHKSKKANIKVDLTPMVDLGFLLISFFVFTTSIAHPTAMKLILPDDNDMSHPNEAPVSKTLNLLLAADNEVYAYNGDSLNHLQHIGKTSTAMRSALLQKKNDIRSRYGSDSDMIVLIKPTPAATYKNLVDALDEMQICTIKTYVLMDASTNEIKKVNN